MVLRSDRRVTAATTEPVAAGAGPGFTVADVGRLLSRERNRQGLSLREVGARTGIPVHQLRGAETGALDRPDGLATLKTVRRYADFLGLPGDRFALAILERWPTKAGPRPFGPPALDRLCEPDATGEVGSGSRMPGGGTTGGAGVTAPRARADRSNHAGTSDDDPTRPVSALGPRAAVSGERDDPSYWGAYSDTGVTPAVLAPAAQVRRRPRRRAPAALQAFVVLLALAVLAGVALLAVGRLEPRWLRAVGISHGAPSHSVTPPTPAPPAAATGARATSSALLRPRTGRDGDLFVVRAPTFTASLTSSGGPCWVRVSTNTSPAPTYQGVVVAGGTRTFTHLRSLVVEMASTAGRLSIRSSGGHVSAYAPRGTYPFKITVRTRR